jgi:hypothetical protein
MLSGTGLQDGTLGRRRRTGDRGLPDPARLYVALTQRVSYRGPAGREVTRITPAWGATAKLEVSTDAPGAARGDG